MQRVLVILVLVLLGAVAILAVNMVDLASAVEDSQLKGSRDARRGGSRRGIDTDSRDERLIQIEKRLQRTTSENTRLQADVRKLTIRISNLAKRIAAGNATSSTYSGSTSETPDRPRDGDGGPVAGRVRDENGNFVVSTEEMDYFRAVQTQIDRNRRIDSQARNYGRRIESLAARGDISAIDPVQQPDIDRVLQGFVTRNDDLVSRYVRKPPPEIKLLSNDERREQLRIAREKYGVEAQRALSQYVGEVDAKTIAERVFTNPWGLRSRKFKR